jgi:hypothetical protein
MRQVPKVNPSFTAVSLVGAAAPREPITMLNPITEKKVSNFRKYWLLLRHKRQIAFYSNKSISKNYSQLNPYHHVDTSKINIQRL